MIEQDIGRVVLPKLYKELGIEIDIEPMAGDRAQAEATSANKDGEIMRIWTYGENNPKTKRVPTPYYYLETLDLYHYVHEDDVDVVSKIEDVIQSMKDDGRRQALIEKAERQVILEYNRK